MSISQYILKITEHNFDAVLLEGLASVRDNNNQGSLKKIVWNRGFDKKSYPKNKPKKCSKKSK
jgi:hypothetical protein